MRRLLPAAALILTITAPAAGAADRIAYQCGPYQDICVADPDGGFATVDLTPSTEGSTETLPSWSPDGQRIAYGSDYAGDGTSDVYVTALADPGVGTNVTRGGRWFEQSAWSPDGTAIAASATSQRSQADPQVFLARADGASQPVRISSGATQEDDARWSPDGTRLAFSRSGLTYVGDAAGAGAAARAVGSVGRWSPDGLRLSTAFKSGLDARGRLTTAADGASVEFGPLLLVPLAAAAWSPDGTKVAWVSPDSTNPVRIASASDPAAAPAAPDLGGLVSVRDVAWSPDGTRLSFTAIAGSEFQKVYVMPADGSSLPRAVGGPSGQQGVWQPQPVNGGGGATGGGGSPGGGGGTGGSGGAGAGGGGGGGGAASGPVAPVVLPPSPSRTPLVVRFAFDRVSINARRLSVGIDCFVQGAVSLPDACRFSGRASGSGSAAATTAARRRTLATGAARVEPGKRGTLRMRLTRAGRSLVRRGGRLRLSIVITRRQAGARTATTRRTVTVRVKRRR